MQHAIIRKRLYQTNLISVFDKVSDVLDKGNAVDLLYLQFIKIWYGTSWEINSEMSEDEDPYKNCEVTKELVKERKGSSAGRRWLGKFLRFGHGSHAFSDDDRLKLRSELTLRGSIISVQKHCNITQGIVRIGLTVM